MTPPLHRLRVAAINFLNPAPLMWDFEHSPLAAALAERYQLHYTLPSLCARELLAGRADLGLIPIAALTPRPPPRPRLRSGLRHRLSRSRPLHPAHHQAPPHPPDRPHHLRRHRLTQLP